jgi:hypothetical protein
LLTKLLQSGRIGVGDASIEVDTMFTMNTKTSAVTERFAIVQGHPHRDEQGGSLTPVTAEADDVLEKWTADQRDGGMGLVPVRSPDGEEYLLLPFSDGSFVKFLLAEGAPLLPGSENAVAAGCICDPERKKLRSRLARWRSGSDDRQRGLPGAPQGREGLLIQTVSDGSPSHGV